MMSAALRRYLFVLFVGWIVLGTGAWAYARMKGIPDHIAVPVAAAFLIELPFYLLPGFPDVLSQIGKPLLPAVMLVGALIPYLTYSVATGVFHWSAFALLVLLVAGVASWYASNVAQALSPVRGRLWDVLFLILLAAIILTRVFNRIYIDPIPKLHIEYLGHIMLIRLAATSVVALRGGSVPEFRFWPQRREWLAGARWFAALMPFAAAAYWALGLVEWRPHPLGIPLALAMFFGVLWVLALSEEFFFRGLLQGWIEKWSGNGLFALIFASVVFGSAHLGFAHAFPNWRFSLVAGIVGVFYGLAWRETRTVQSSMVAHALVVTVWRVFLK